jgi:hypothetical protein
MLTFEPQESLPEALADPVCWRAFTEVIEATVQDVTQIPDVNWDPELFEYWRMRLDKIHIAAKRILHMLESR